MYNALYRLDTAVQVDFPGTGVYACAAKGKGGRAAVLLVNNRPQSVSITPVFAGAADAPWRVTRLDSIHPKTASGGSWGPGTSLELPSLSLVLLEQGAGR